MCVFEQNLRGECQHFSDGERAISGTCVTDEFGLTVEKLYKIQKIHEVYEYQVTQYNQETDQGGIFAGYINTFLKLKGEGSGYPSWVRTQNDEDQYIETFRQRQGILLDNDSNIMLQNGDWRNSVLIPCEVNLRRTQGKPRQY